MKTARDNTADSQDGDLERLPVNMAAGATSSTLSKSSRRPNGGKSPSVNTFPPFGLRIGRRDSSKKLSFCFTHLVSAIKQTSLQDETGYEESTHALWYFPSDHLDDPYRIYDDWTFQVAIRALLLFHDGTVRVCVFSNEEVRLLCISRCPWLRYSYR